MKVKKHHLLILIVLSFYAFSESPKVNLKYSNTQLESSWKFLPEMPDAFKNLENEELYADLKIKKYKLIFQKNNFSGRGTRKTHPKEIESSIDIDMHGISYDLDEEHNIFYLYEKSVVKPEIFSCYQKGNLVIGGCDEADFKITSSLSKYENLGENILSIDGGAEMHTLGISFKELFPYFNQATISYSVQKNKFDWMTPFEEIRSPVILNAEVNGQTVGNLINEMLNDLPQRELWETHIYSIKFLKDYNLKYFDFFYELNSIKGNRKNFTKFKDTNKFNHRLKLGISKKINNFQVKFMGNFYTNFLLWKRDELYNRRTVRYFDKKFGDLKLELLYRF
tara:strand:+ start:992 stop:2002 length:1011 start_codon:yes stop_codon:yes gene_type:complete